jgi:hypothetical protein
MADDSDDDSDNELLVNIRRNPVPKDTIENYDQKVRQAVYEQASRQRQSYGIDRRRIEFIREHADDNMLVELRWREKAKEGEARPRTKQEQRPIVVQKRYMQRRVPNSLFVFVDVARDASRILNAGDGLFALSHIPKGTIIGVYNGRVVVDSDDKRGYHSSVRPDRHDVTRTISFYRLSGRFSAVVNPLRENYMQLINEPPVGCSSNCLSIDPATTLDLLTSRHVQLPRAPEPEAKRRRTSVNQREENIRRYPSIVACRDIFAGEQIFMLYGSTPWAKYKKGEPCNMHLIEDWKLEFAT